MEKKTVKRIMLHPYNDNGQLDTSINLFPEAGGLKCEEVDINNAYERITPIIEETTSAYTPPQTSSGITRSQVLPIATSTTSDFVIVNNLLYVKVIEIPKEEPPTPEEPPLVIEQPETEEEGLTYTFNNAQYTIMPGTEEGEGDTVIITTNQIVVL